MNKKDLIYVSAGELYSCIEKEFYDKWNIKYRTSFDGNHFFILSSILIKSIRDIIRKYSYNMDIFCLKNRGKYLYIYSNYYNNKLSFKISQTKNHIKFKTVIDNFKENAKSMYGVTEVGKRDYCIFDDANQYDTDVFISNFNKYSAGLDISQANINEFIRDITEYAIDSIHAGVTKVFRKYYYKYYTIVGDIYGFHFQYISNNTEDKFHSTNIEYFLIPEQ